jgi:hypothetical protein
MIKELCDLLFKRKLNYALYPAMQNPDFNMDYSAANDDGLTEIDINQSGLSTGPASKNWAPHLAPDRGITGTLNLRAPCSNGGQKLVLRDIPYINCNRVAAFEQYTNTAYAPSRRIRYYYENGTINSSLDLYSPTSISFADNEDS